MQKRRHRLGISVVDRHGRHALVGTSLLNDRDDRLAVLVGQHELRSKKVRPAELSATGVRAVAGAARHRVDRPAALDHGRIAWRPLLGREYGASSLSSAAGRDRSGRRGRLSGRLRASVNRDDGEACEEDGGETVRDFHSTSFPTCGDPPGFRGVGAGNGSVSGNTRTPDVTFSGYFPPLGNFSSTKNAVHPVAGGVTRAI